MKRIIKLTCFLFLLAAVVVSSVVAVGSQDERTISSISDDEVAL